MDRRDAPTWVVLELSPYGESRASEGKLEVSLREQLGVDEDFPVFIPSMVYKRGSKTVVLHLMQGYAFIGSGLVDTQYYALENGSLVNQVLTTSTGGVRLRTINTVPDHEIREMRHKLRRMVAVEFEPGTQVDVKKGLYKHLQGQVVEVVGDDAILLFSFRSLSLLTEVPCAFLEVANAEAH